MHHQPPAAKYLWHVSRGSSVPASHWLRTTSHGPFPVQFLGLEGKPGVSKGLLLLADVQAVLLDPEHFQQTFKDRGAFEFSWQLLEVRLSAT